MSYCRLVDPCSPDMHSLSSGVEVYKKCTPRRKASDALTSDADSSEEEEEKLLLDDWIEDDR